jgi:ABC-type uncharacterized transport system substrate-binding protein
MPALADELIGLRPDVVIGIESVAIVMRSKTKSIPIVSYCFTKSGGSRARKDARAAGYQCHGDGLPL